jgi:competence protein ComEC
MRLPATPKITDAVPLLIPSVGFMGTLLSFQTGWPPGPYLFLFLIIAGSIALVTKSRLGSMIGLMIGVIAGFSVLLVHNADDSGRLRHLLSEQEIDSEEPAELLGIVKTSPDILPDGFRFIIDTSAVVTPRFCSSVSGTVAVRVRTKTASPAIVAGEKVSIACFPRRDEMFRNPGGFSYVAHLDAEGLDAVCSLKSDRLIESFGDTDVGIRSVIGTFRNALIAKTISTLGPMHGGIVVAVTMGNKEFLDGRAAELFRRGGLFHLLIISGLHMTFIAGLVLALARLLTESRWLHFLIVTPVIWVYVEMVGWERPVVRACLMFSLILFGRCLFRSPDPLNPILATAIVALIVSPADIFTASFQLTFLSVVAITSIGIPMIGGLRRIGEWTPDSSSPFPPRPGLLRSLAETLYWNPRAWEVRSRSNSWKGSVVKYPFIDLSRWPVLMRWLSRFTEGVTVTLSVIVALLPLQILLFHRVSPAGVFLNLLMAPLIAFQALVGIASVAIAGIMPIGADVLTSLAVLSGDLGLGLARSVLDLGMDDLRIPIYTGWRGVLYPMHLLLMGFVILRIRNWNPFSGHRKDSKPTLILCLTLGASCLLMLLTPFSTPFPDGRLKVHFLDVGQGDSAFVEFPDGTTMLIDAGGIPIFSDGDSTEDFTPDSIRIGEAVVSEFLWEKGYSHIDLVIGTHSHADHIQGLVDVLSNFSVGSIHLGEMKSDSKEYSHLVEISRRRGVIVRHAFAGDSMKIGGTTVEILNPSRKGGVQSANEGSLVLRLDFRGRRFLFTGDIESAGEAFVSSQRNVSADVVKVPHHGSRTSSSKEFIEAVKARYAVIPVGRRSRFGHPHSEVVARWKEAGAEVMTTGAKGTVTFVTDGREISVSTFVED